VEKGRVGSHETIDDSRRRGQGVPGARYGEFLDESIWWRAPALNSIWARYRSGLKTPVFFGSAVNQFRCPGMLSAFVKHSPGPLPRPTLQRVVEADEAQPPVSCSDPGPTWIPAIATGCVHEAVSAAMRAACACVMCGLTRISVSPMR